MTTLLTYIEMAILWVHIFTAMIFVGGSFFIWLVVMPSSYKITDDEKLRTKIVGTIGKNFAFFTNISVVILVLTGLYNLTWYLPGGNYIYALFNTTGGQILLYKMILVLAMILLMYGNNLYHGKKIMSLVREGKMDEVRRIRKRTHFLSYVTLLLMVIITILAVSLQFY
ncbi:MAG: CopD family protein [Candidatus Thermoplasmatota archaeon]|nr:CopD family protein [Candidatus Thermoplasmatota archaeon]MCL5988485.1 CopD family protein [Candidatus Thermoplasmatota archaeon]